jgi:hypothetical protein
VHAGIDWLALAALVANALAALFGALVGARNGKK